ncbi:creatininase family protein [Halorussus marinus]|uniref:creatininase family protein n=1 Tax=Halorussus marinus TaxID=2505976 RepID=UPI0010922036|nr:creatininase family protein [Halorussus marinus]
MTDETLRLDDMTWTEVEAALEDGTRTAVVAVGSIEQHGPHLPLRMDTIAGEAVTERIAAKLGDALAAPPIQPGCSGHHMSFPGTITIPPETLMDLIESYCRSLDEHGFECIALVPTHGGNFGPVNTVAPELARELDATIVTLADLEENMALMNEGMAEAGVDYEEPSIHAGAAETAVVLAVEEGLVRTDALEPGAEGEISAARMINGGFEAVTENGVLGDPREGTAEAGEAIVERMASAYADQIEAARDLD